MKNWDLKHELSLFLWGAADQLCGYSWKFVHQKATGLSALKLFIQVERGKMTRNLWYRICFKYNWTCQNCGIRNFMNRDLTKPKMEIDHIRSLFHYGTTVEANLQVLCKPCNRAKGVN